MKQRGGDPREDAAGHPARDDKSRAGGSSPPTRARRTSRWGVGPSRPSTADLALGGQAHHRDTPRAATSWQ